MKRNYFKSLYERAEAAISCFSSIVVFYNIFILCLWLKNHRKIQSRCLSHEFYMAVATYYYYEKVRRTMLTAIVSYFLEVCNEHRKMR